LTAAFGSSIEGCICPVYCVNVILIRNLLDSVLKLDGRGSSVGLVTAYGLDGPGIESWWG